MRSLAIRLAAPSADTLRGNGVTARRWAGFIRELGHEVVLARELGDQECDLLVALHAVKTAQSVQAFRARWPHRPVVVGLAGTDVYGGLESAEAQASLAAATRVVALQERAR